MGRSALILSTNQIESVCQRSAARYFATSQPAGRPADQPRTKQPQAQQAAASCSRPAENQAKGSYTPQAPSWIPKGKSWDEKREKEESYSYDRKDSAETQTRALKRQKGEKLNRKGKRLLYINERIALTRKGKSLRQKERLETKRQGCKEKGKSSMSLRQKHGVETEGRGWDERTGLKRKGKGWRQKDRVETEGQDWNERTGLTREGSHKKERSDMKRKELTCKGKSWDEMGRVETKRRRNWYFEMKKKAFSLDKQFQPLPSPAKENVS